MSSAIMIAAARRHAAIVCATVMREIALPYARNPTMITTGALAPKAAFIIVQPPSSSALRLIPARIMKAAALLSVFASGVLATTAIAASEDDGPVMPGVAWPDRAHSGEGPSPHDALEQAVKTAEADQG